MTIRGISILTLTILYLPIAAAQQVTSPDVMLYEHPENQWFEAPSGRVNVSDDAQWAIFSGGAVIRLVSLATGTEDAKGLTAGLDSVQRAVYCGSGKIARLGQRGPSRGWFLPTDDANPVAPDDARLRCSPDGRLIAYVTDKVVLMCLLSERPSSTVRGGVLLSSPYQAIVVPFTSWYFITMASHRSWRSI